MKKIIILFLILFLPINVLALNLKSNYAIMYNLNDNTVIYELNSNDRISIASMTKIMTCIVAIENIDNLDNKIEMSSDMFYGLVEENASVAGFKVGEVVTYRDLIYGLMLPSGADAAQALAIKTSGNVDNFVAKMNKKVTELGLKNTHFSNTTGLDKKDNYSSVFDVASILKYALKNEDFNKVFTASKYVTSNKKHTFTSTRLKYNLDTSFIDGSKTGFTNDAGVCMASTSHYNGVNYLLVTAKAPTNNRTNHILDAKELYSYFFNNYEYRKIINKGDEIVTIESDDKIIKYSINVEMIKYLNKNCNLEKKYDGKTRIDKDSKIGDKLGTYIVKCDNDVLYTKDIYLNIDMTEEKENYKLMIIYIICGIIILLSGILLFKRKRRR